MNPNRPYFSIIVGTARKSYGSYVAFPSDHLFAKTFESLASQGFQDFEVIIVDSLPDRDLGAEIRGLRTWPFHWTVVKNDSPWLAHGLWSLQRAQNIGAVQSRGKTLIFGGDCCVFPSHALDSAAKYVDQRVYPHFVCERTRGGGVTSPDHRKAWFKDGFYCSYNDNWTWYFHYGCISRENFFYVNGWSELFDGEKSLTDCELGSRLQQCGRLHLYMREHIFVMEEEHASLALTPKVSVSLRSNYELIQLHRKLQVTRANSVILPEARLRDVIHGRVSPSKDWQYYDKLEPVEIASFNRYWIDNQPTYDLEDFCAGG